MTWGSFGLVHILSLLVSAGIIVGLYFLLKNRSDRVQTIVLGVLSFSGIAAIIFNLVAWGSPLEYLPFHLCSLSAMVLPFAVFTKSKVLNNLLLLWGLGALLALVVNTAQANYEIFSLTFAFYYFPHTLEFGLAILMFLLGRVRLDVKCVPTTLGITFGVYTLIHLINVWLNAYCLEHNIVDYAGNVIRVNYMYSIEPTNPVLDLIFTGPYWYMFLTIPFILLYLGCIYSKQIWSAIKNRKKEK